MIGVNTNLHLHERFTVIGTNSNLDLFVKLADPWYYLSPGPHTQSYPSSWEMRFLGHIRGTVGPLVVRGLY